MLRALCWQANRVPLPLRRFYSFDYQRNPQIFSWLISPDCNCLYNSRLPENFFSLPSNLTWFSAHDCRGLDERNLFHSLVLPMKGGRKERMNNKIFVDFVSARRWFRLDANRYQPRVIPNIYLTLEIFRQLREHPRKPAGERESGIINKASYLLSVDILIARTNQ